MEKFLIYSHIVAGGTVLMLGLVNFISKKGTKSHVLIGRIYVGAMWWICFSAFSIILFYRFNAFLLVIGVLTFYASFVGVRVMRRKKAGSHRWYDWAVSIVTALFGIGLCIYSIHIFTTTNQVILGFLCLFFGFFTVSSAYQDMKFFWNPKKLEKRWWLYQHMSAISGSYIAAITAFAVQNPNLFMPGSSNQWLLWILPSVIGSPLSTYAIKKQRKKYESQTAPV